MAVKKKPNQSYANQTVAPPQNQTIDPRPRRNMSVASGSDLRPRAKTESADSFIRAREQLQNQTGQTGRRGQQNVTRALSQNGYFPQDEPALDQLSPQELEQGPASATANLESPTLFDASNLATDIPAIGTGIATGAGLGAGVGAAIGSVVPVLGTAIGGTVGAGIGGTIGGVSAYLGKLSLDRRQLTKDSFQVYQSAKASDTELLQLAKSGAFPPSDVLFLYETNLANTLEARRNLRELTKSKVGADLSGAMDELIEVEGYLDLEATRRAQLLIALQAGQAQSI